VDINVLVTAPPYASYLDEVAQHGLVSGFRFNTVMPLREDPNEALQRLSSFEQPLWIDLKGRQLRVAEPAIPPYTSVLLSHPIHVQTPVDVFFSDGTERARVAAVDGRRLILEYGPRRLIGPGESVNIIHPSLEIEGTLTKTDHTYLQAMKQEGLNRIMLSYVETPADVEEIRELFPKAEIMLKIETQRGLSYVKEYSASQGRLVAGRGDLFVEVLRPHRIVGALREIITQDPDAVVASRLLDSLAHHPVPVSAEISDIAFLLSLGYRTFLLGDAICFQKETVLEALNLLEAIAGQFP
jgi:pyruvate kinase